VLLATPSVAWAKSAVVSPFVGKTGVDSLQVLNITSLVASEVDFSMTFDAVHQLEAMPAGMNINCLANPTCLAGVAKAAGADVVIAGSVAKAGEEFDIFMVHYDTSGGIVRKNTWKVPTDPTRMADRMSSLVTEILTGKSTEQAKKEDDLSALTDISTSDMMDDEEEFKFEDEGELQVGRRVATPELSDRDLDDFEALDAEDEGRDAQLAAQRAREAEAKAAAAAAAERKRQEDEARARAAAEAERKRQEEAARARAAAEAERRRQEEEARVRAEAERRRQEEEARARAEAERRRQEEQEEREEQAARSRTMTGDDEASGDDDEFSFAPVSAADMGLEFAPAENLITVEDSEYDDFEGDEEEEDDDYGTTAGRDTSGSRTPTSGGRSGSYVVEATDDFDDFDEIDTHSDRDDRSSSYGDLDEDESMSDRVKRQEQERKAQEAEARRAAEARAARERQEASRYEELDEGRSSRREGVGTISGGHNERQKVSLAARFGTSGFQDLQFLTYGGELAFPVGESARIETGLEAFSVRRQYDVSTGLCETTEIDGQEVVGCYRWNSILPFHVGARYQRSDKKVRPYIGGDLTLTPYTEDFKLAFGFRGRGGVDFVPTKVFGLNLNLSAGMMHGSEFEFVQKDMSNTGLLWQVSAGTVFMM
jgi:flagellar biosynthesis GTPase FlhF